MAWSRVEISDFSIKVQRGRGDATFSLKHATSFSLGIIKQYITKNAQLAQTNTVIEAMNFLNHLFAVGPTLSLVPVGRKFFTNSASDIHRFEIIEFRTGLFQAIHFGGNAALTLNVDITTGVFWNSDMATVLDLLSYYMRIPPAQLTSKRLSPSQLQT